jgi:hypothetical protein
MHVQASASDKLARKLRIALESTGFFWKKLSVWVLAASVCA